MRILCLTLSLIVLVPGLARAACTGSSPTWTATVDRASVNTCVGNASDGDTINVGAGSATWSSSITISGKGLTILGAGSGATLITTGSFFLEDASNTRISGFRFNLNGAGQYLVIINGTLNFRIDHNIITNPSWDTCVELYNYMSLTVNHGLIDHNTLTNCRLVTFGGAGGYGAGDNYHWTLPNPVGTANATYIEDNDFLCPTTFCVGVADNNHGGSTTFRFNSVQSGQVDLHGLQGDDQRGSRSLEYYYNAFTNTPDPAYRMGMIRAGTGMVFHNTSDGGHFGVNGWTLDNNRTVQNPDPAPVMGPCDGSSPADGNDDASGWPCRDQIGRGQDAFLWNFSSPYPDQASVPWFIWNNKDTSTGFELEYEIQCPEGTQAECDRQLLQIVESRDYYTYRTSFNGTVGVGEGTLAARPATCTTGVAYWATDQGSWNTSTSNPEGVQLNGADGVLYRCASTNTWASYYTPYTYPHPLQGGVAAPDPVFRLRFRTASLGDLGLILAGLVLAGRVYAVRRAQHRARR